MLWSTTCLLQSATIHPEPQLQGEGSREVFYCFWLFAFPLSYIPWLYKRLLKSLTHVIWTDPKSFHDRQDKLGKAFYGAVLRTKPICLMANMFFHAFLPTSKTPNVTCWSWTYHLLISWIFLGSFCSHFLSHFARSLRRRFHSIEFKRTQGCKRTYGTRSKPSKLSKQSEAVNDWIFSPRWWVRGGRIPRRSFKCEKSS